VSKILGHASTSIATDVYQHVTLEDLEENVRSFCNSNPGSSGARGDVELIAENSITHVVTHVAPFSRISNSSINVKTPSFTGFLLGAAHRNRTDNLPITNRVLYRIELERPVNELHNQTTVTEGSRRVKPVCHTLQTGCVVIPRACALASRSQRSFRSCPACPLVQSQVTT
jgi:hypothetical protein